MAGRSGVRRLFFPPVRHHRIAIRIRRVRYGKRNSQVSFYRNMRDGRVVRAGLSGAEYSGDETGIVMGHVIFVSPDDGFFSQFQHTVL